MIDAKKFKVTAPIGNVVVKELMNEGELREFAGQLIQDASSASVWHEKAAKDPIQEVVDWLRQSGYTIEEK